jgi:Gpi18-like mannosyltransferase
MKVTTQQIMNRPATDSAAPTGILSLSKPRERFFLCGLLFVILLQIRVSLWYISTSDVSTAFLPWLDYITMHGRLHSLRDPIGDYSPIYYFTLALVSYIQQLHPISQIKFIPLVFDIFAAFMAYRIVEQLDREASGPSRAGVSTKPIIAALVTFALPSLLLNGALWGQCDSTYISLLLACLYCLMRQAPARATLFFAFALSFKLQTVFFVPVLLVALLRGRVRWWHLLLVPLVWCAALLPSILAGRPLRYAAASFSQQTTEFKVLAIDVANPWVWYPLLHLSYTLGICVGLLITAAAIAALIWIGYTRTRITAAWLLFFTTLCLATLPYVMPKMHERYFLPSQVFLVILACHDRRFVLPAVLMECALLLPYLNYFSGIINVWNVALAFIASTAALVLLYRELRNTRTQLPASPNLS